MSEMRAVAFTEFGGPEVLHVIALPAGPYVLSRPARARRPRRGSDAVGMVPGKTSPVVSIRGSAIRLQGKTSHEPER
jgi:hypothetical protein